MLFSVLLFVGLPILVGTLFIAIVYKAAQFLASFFSRIVILVLTLGFTTFALGAVDGSESSEGVEFLHAIVGALGANVVPYLIDGFIAFLEWVVSF